MLVNSQNFGISEEQLESAKQEFLGKLSKEQRNAQAVYEAGTRAHKSKYSDFMARKCNVSTMQEDVTQPYYQSLVLSRKRLDEKNLDIDMVLDTHEISDHLPFTAKKDEKFNIGERQDALKVARTYIQDGKKIRSVKTKETSKITFLNVNIDDKLDTFCPNCGYADNLSGFIDGCDACGATFTVNDFEPKVAGFSLQENIVSHYYRNILLAWLAFACTVAIAVGIVIFSGYFEYGLIGVMAFAAQFIPSLLGVLVIISRVLKNVWDTVLNESKVKDVWSWFASDDFLQNLEYKIKNIHMASSSKEVAAFAKCSLDSAVSSYQDVIDCDVANVKFEDVSSSGDGYRISFLTTLRVIELKGKKIKTRYEKVKASVFGRKGIVDQPITTFREYKCSNCGTSLNLLEGAVCHSCGTEFDYADYNWVFTEYTPQKSRLSLYQKGFIGFYFYFLIIFIITVILFSLNIFLG